MAITPTAVDTGVPKRKSSGAGGAHMPLQMNLSGRISPMDAMASTPSQFRHALSSATVPTIHHVNLLFNKAPDCTLLSLGRCSLMIGLFWPPQCPLVPHRGCPGPSCTAGAWLQCQKCYCKTCPRTWIEVWTTRSQPG